MDRHLVFYWWNQRENNEANCVYKISFAMFAKIQYKGRDVERQTFSWVCWYNHQNISAANVSLDNFPLILPNFLETSLATPAFVASRTFIFLILLHLQSNRHAAQDQVEKWHQKIDDNLIGQSLRHIPDPRRSENWSVENGARQARKVRF